MLSGHLNNLLLFLLQLLLLFLTLLLVVHHLIALFLVAFSQLFRDSFTPSILDGRNFNSEFLLVLTVLHLFVQFNVFFEFTLSFPSFNIDFDRLAISSFGLGVA
jgi:hypothetical protein